MAWRVDTTSKQRWKVVREILKGERSTAAICRTYGISRKTAYKWLERHREEGQQGLEDRSRAPHRQAAALPAEIEELIVHLRRRHREWGARKLQKILSRRGLGRWRPSLSTVQSVLSRRGLIGVRVKRKRVPLWQGRFTKADRCNRVWRADYKGYFWTLDGVRNEPLTVTDGRSRFLLVLKRCSGTGEEEAKRAFKAAFKRYGLPEVILTDNGNPFATSNVTGLTRLSLWWLKLGIRHERTAPGHPEQNGSHERFHKTLKQSAIQPPAPTVAAQDRRFARFAREYNEVRPHQALGQETPASLYRASSRKLPKRLPMPSYPASMLLRRVRHNGTIKWQGASIYVGEVLAREQLGIQTNQANGVTSIHLYDRLLGTIGLRRGEKFLKCDPPPPRGRRVASKPRKKKKV